MKLKLTSFNYNIMERVELELTKAFPATEIVVRRKFPFGWPMEVTYVKRAIYKSRQCPIEGRGELKIVEAVEVDEDKPETYWIRLDGWLEPVYLNEWDEWEIDPEADDFIIRS